MEVSQPPSHQRTSSGNSFSFVSALGGFMTSTTGSQSQTNYSTSASYTNGNHHSSSYSNLNDAKNKPDLINVVGALTGVKNIMGGFSPAVGTDVEKNKKHKRKIELLLNSMRLQTPTKHSDCLLALSAATSAPIISHDLNFTWFRKEGDTLILIQEAKISSQQNWYTPTADDIGTTVTLRCEDTLGLGLYRELDSTSIFPDDSLVNLVENSIRNNTFQVNRAVIAFVKNSFNPFQFVNNFYTLPLLNDLISNSDVETPGCIDVTAKCLFIKPKDEQDVGILIEATPYLNVTCIQPASILLTVPLYQQEILDAPDPISSVADLSSCVHDNEPILRWIGPQKGDLFTGLNDLLNSISSPSSGNMNKSKSDSKRGDVLDTISLENNHNNLPPSVNLVITCKDRLTRDSLALSIRSLCGYYPQHHSNQNNGELLETMQFEFSKSQEVTLKDRFDALPWKSCEDMSLETTYDIPIIEQETQAEDSQYVNSLLEQIKSLENQLAEVKQTQQSNNGKRLNVDISDISVEQCLNSYGDDYERIPLSPAALTSAASFHHKHKSELSDKVTERLQHADEQEIVRGVVQELMLNLIDKEVTSKSCLEEELQHKEVAIKNLLLENESLLYKHAELLQQFNQERDRFEAEMNEQFKINHDLQETLNNQFTDSIDSKLMGKDQKIQELSVQLATLQEEMQSLKQLTSDESLSQAQVVNNCIEWDAKFYEKMRSLPSQHQDVSTHEFLSEIIEVILQFGLESTKNGASLVFDVSSFVRSLSKKYAPASANVESVPRDDNDSYDEACSTSNEHDKDSDTIVGIVESSEQYYQQELVNFISRVCALHNLNIELPSRDITSSHIDKVIQEASVSLQSISLSHEDAIQKLASSQKQLVNVESERDKFLEEVKLITLQLENERSDSYSSVERLQESLRQSQQSIVVLQNYKSESEDMFQQQEESLRVFSHEVEGLRNQVESLQQEKVSLSEQLIVLKRELQNEIKNREQLSKQKAEADFVNLQLMDEKKKLESSLVTFKSESLSGKVNQDSLANEVIQLKTQLTSLEKRYQIAQADVLKLSDDRQALSKQVAPLDQLKREVTQLRGQLIEADQTYQATKLLLTEIKAENEKLLRQQNEMTVEMNSLREALQQKNAIISELNSKIDGFGSEHISIEKEKTSLRKENVRLRNTINNLQIDLDKLKSLEPLYEQQMAMMADSQAKVAELEGTISRLQKASTLKVLELIKLELQNGHIDTTNQRLEIQVEHLNASWEDAASRVMQYREAIRRLTAANSKLKADLELARVSDPVRIKQLNYMITKLTGEKNHYEQKAKSLSKDLQRKLLDGTPLQRELGRMHGRLEEVENERNAFRDAMVLACDIYTQQEEDDNSSWLF